MKTGLLTSLLGAVLCVLAVGSPARAGIITFGSGANQFDMEFVEIGAPGNAADTTGTPNPAGAVPYVYNMGKFEVSRDMITKANNLGGLAITMSDMSSFGGNGVNRPATGVTWNEAARFVNWLNTSQGFSPAYKFEFQPGEAGYSANADIELWTAGDAGFDPSNRFRNSEAQYFLPSVDEWYKAAYYDPVTDTYFDFPTGSDTAPTAVASGTLADTAVYGQPIAQGPADIMDAGGLSPFGLMALGGNLMEWEETEFDFLNDVVSSDRALRGSSWDNSAADLSSSTRLQSFPGFETFNIGFRVASLSSGAAVVPEPSSLAVWTLLVVCALCYGRRRLGR